MRIYATVAATLLAGAVSAQQGIPPPTVPPPIPPTTTPPTTTPPTVPQPVVSPILNPSALGPYAPGMPIPMDSAVVMGRVVDQGGRAVPKALVRIISRTHLDSVLADSQGRFAFRSVTPGDVLVIGSKQGYLEGAHGKRRASGQPLPITVVAGQATTGVRIQLFKSAVITGVVTDEGGDPISNTTVVALVREYSKGPWQHQEVASATTDDNGAYRLYGLSPGQYIVAVPTTVLSAAADESGAVNIPLASGEQATLVGLPTTNVKTSATTPAERVAIWGGPTPPKDDGSSGVYSTQYFPGTEYRQLALPITLIAGEVRYAVNFRMPLVQSYSVSGRLTGPEGSYGRQMVRLVSIGTDYGSRTDAAVTLSSADGTFLFPRVPRGEYRLETNSGDLALGGSSTPIEVLNEDARPAQKTYVARVPVTVVDENVVLKEVPVSEGAWCAVLYDFKSGSGGAADAYSGTTVRLVPARPGLSQPGPMKDPGAGINVATGLVPGLYVVTVSGIPPGWYLQSITVDEQPALDGPVEIRSPGSTVVVTLGQTATRLEGTVRDSRSMVFGGATVIVMPARMPEGILMPNRVRETRSSPAGVFIAEGLPPGDYLVAAIDDAMADGWQDSKVITQLRTIATRVRIGDTVQAIEVRVGTIKK